MTIPRSFNRGPKGRHTLVPQIPFVVFNLIPFKELQKLVLKSSFTMVTFLIANLADHFLLFRLANAKCSVPLLPRKRPSLKED